MPFILKMRRIEFLFETIRQLREKSDDNLSLSERADIELVDDLRTHSSQYMKMSNIFGVNIGFFSYQIMKIKLHWYIAMPIAFSAFFVSRNVILRNCMDRIYYSSEHVYMKSRGHDKKKEAESNSIHKKTEISKED